MPSWVTFPKDVSCCWSPLIHLTNLPQQRLFNKSVQTECDPDEADATLAEVDPIMLTKGKEVNRDVGEVDQDTRNKKRKRI